MEPNLSDYHLLAKPAGAACNLGCQYCFFLSKENLYQGDSHLMDESTLDTYIRQLMDSSPGPQVDVAWQGGEPMLRGLDFYKRSVELAERYRKPHQQILHTIQTNGTLIDDAWARFFKQHNYLVGVSFDEWVRRDVGKIYVTTFDTALGSWLGQHNAWTVSPTCGNALALEHNGDVYSCDHFVEPDHRLGNIKDTPLGGLVRSAASAGPSTTPCPGTAGNARCCSPATANARATASSRRLTARMG